MGILKIVISGAVSAGVDRVITDAIKSTTPETVKPVAKVLRKVGTLALGWFVGDWAATKAEEKYDEIMESINGLNEIREKIKAGMEVAENEANEETLEEVVEETEKETDE